LGFATETPFKDYLRRAPFFAAFLAARFTLEALVAFFFPLPVPRELPAELAPMTFDF
jgi:hypothetical protein